MTDLEKKAATKSGISLTLAAEYVGRDGKKHKADETVEFDASEAAELIRTGRARAAD